MKRLRHPIRAIREPFGTAGLIVAMIALVAALGGTALAAAKLNSTQKKEVEKIAKKFAGKPGATGAAGPAGPAAANGKNGAPGEAGAEGLEGKEGSPWTAGGTLPSGSTETGTWSTGHVAEGTSVHTPISFPIPLASKLEAAAVKVVGESGNGEECPGSVAEPQAKPGFLCLYEETNFGFASGISVLQPGGGFTLGAATSGAFVAAGAFSGGPGEAYGTWAVTAP